MPEVADEVAPVLNGWDAPTQMIEGDDWCENQFLDTTGSTRALVTHTKPKEQVLTLVPYL
ncbi:MAG: hypothetical protein CMQ19_00825 [Gammaproteobacteria bacterium]|nr:hypothetical protein [Gammaproteobacteria bacterium]